MKPFTALKNCSPFPFTSLHFTSLHFTSLHFTSFHITSLFIFYFISFFFTYPVNPSLHFTLLLISTTHFTSLSFTFYFLSPFPLTGFPFPDPLFENMNITVGSPYCPFRQSVPLSNGPIHKAVFPDVCSLPSGSDFRTVIDPT
jgi:hypothetical protein